MTCPRQQIAIHAFRVHGQCRLPRSCIDTPYCPVCLQMFYSREKVIVHTEEKSPRCKLVVSRTFTRLDAQAVLALNAADACEARHLAKKGRRRHFCSIMSSRMPGPLSKEAYMVGISHSAWLRAPAAKPFNSKIIGLAVDAHSPG